MAPRDLPFPEIKSIFIGKEFEDLEMIKLNVTQQHLAILKIGARCVSSSGTATGISASKQKGPTLKGSSPSSS
jgi:hypothetical protein